MPYFVVQKAERILGLQGKSLRGSKILVLGVTYKADLPDLRESPAVKVIQLLLEEGAEVSYHDPFIPEVSVAIGYGNSQNSYDKRATQLTSRPLTEDALKSADIVLITTDHSCVDYETVVDEARFVLDCRHSTRGIGENRTNVQKL